MSKLVNIVVDSKAEMTDRFYTYKAPDEIFVGAKVSVRFGNRKKCIDGYVVETDVSTDFDLSKINDIDSFDKQRSLSEEMIKTSLWMRKRYGIKYIDAIKLFTVSGKKIKERKELSEEMEDEDFDLTEDQILALDRINSAIQKGENKSFLIHGVTGSGKTEVYMKAVSECLALGKTAIILLPEIALSTQIKKRFEKRFGQKNIATIHSKLSTSKKLEEWLRIKTGEARIVIGARTSVFAPLENIGLIVIDEEHESTYKSDHNPKYETVDVAFMRAKLSDAILLLGSATPSVTSYKRAENGIYELIDMPKRVGDAIMPILEVVDMRMEKRLGNDSEISDRLQNEISYSLSRGEQIILFLNRRGYFTQILCPSCGYRFECDDCGISLTYHKSIDKAVCHYCDKKFDLPKKCPSCGSELIKYSGSGTEKIEELVASTWPEAKVSRFDLDTATNLLETEKVIRDFEKGKTNILIGTQILAKGLDFKNVGLVGIINADVSLNIPDYRSSERTYQLITQVAGRAGRTGGKSRVLIQTYSPDSDIIKTAATNDYKAFYDIELEHRNIMKYPPFSDIISVSLCDKREDTSYSFGAAKWVRNFMMNLKDAPKDAVFLDVRQTKRKSDDCERYSFIIKAPPGSRRGFVEAYMNIREEMIQKKSNCYIEIDVNPYTMV